MLSKYEPVCYELLRPELTWGCHWRLARQCAGGMTTQSSQGLPRHVRLDAANSVSVLGSFRGQNAYQI